MIDAAFESLVHQRQHIVLSSDRPLSLQHSALLLMHRLQTASNVRVAAEAPLDPTELIEHVNKIVAGLSIRQATDTDTDGSQLAVLPVRVGADRQPDSLTLLARLCRALPGSGLRLMLIVEHRAALADCLASVGSNAFHWDIGAAEPDADQTPASLRTSSTGQSSTLTASSSTKTEDTEPSEAEAPVARPRPEDRSGAPAPAAPTPKASTSMMARLVDSASRKPLRFALWVAGVPGLLIAGVLAIGSALQPSRPAGQPTTVPALAPASARTLPPSPTKSEPASSQPSSAPPPSKAEPAPARPDPAPARPDPSATRTEPALPRTEPTAPAPSTATSSAQAPATPAPAPAAARPATPQEPSPGPAAAPAAFECSPARTTPPQLQPRNPSKDGGMVYLTSSRLVVVCVTDGSGALTRAEITPDQPRSFFGKAPWQVQASSLRDLQVFFQGSRITLPRTATDRFELTEQRLN